METDPSEHEALTADPIDDEPELEDELGNLDEPVDDTESAGTDEAPTGP